MDDLAAYTKEELRAAICKRVESLESFNKAEGQPSAYLLAGQPGSGKTTLSSMLGLRHNGNVILINGDEYRRFHPNYRKLHEVYGTESVQKTSAFSSAVTEALIMELSDRRFNLIIEGTGRTVEVPSGTASLLTTKGYTVSMLVIAVRPAISLISTLQRFYKMSESGDLPRATPISAHDKVVNALPKNLDVLNGLPTISNISIWTRDGVKIYDNSENMMQPSLALMEFWNQPLSQKELSEATEIIEWLRQAEGRMHFGQNELIDEAERRLNELERVENEQERVQSGVDRTMTLADWKKRISETRRAGDGDKATLPQKDNKREKER